MIKKVKNNVLWKYVISGINGEEILGTFHDKKIEKKQINKNLEQKM